MKSEADDPEIS